MTTNNNLFMQILDTAATAEAAKQTLREAIFWAVVNTTATNNRTDASTFDRMRIMAETAVSANFVEIQCDGKAEYKFDFTEGDSQRQLRTLQKLYDIIIQYHAWYEDDDNDNSFCWHYNNHKYNIIFQMIM